jgi:hypothetical protein
VTEQARVRDRREGAPAIARTSITRASMRSGDLSHGLTGRLREQLTAASSTAVTTAGSNILPMTDDSYQSDWSASRSTDVASITDMTAFASVYWSRLAQWAVACRANVPGGGLPGM